MKTTITHEKKSVRFEFATECGKNVFVAGSFNNWSPDKNRLKERSRGEYFTTLPIPLGRHEYKFVVDGVWHIDGVNPRWTPNDEGTLNSVITVD